MNKDIIRVQEKTSCECRGPGQCGCPPCDTLLFMVNGQSGFGSGDLGMDVKTGKESFQCKFLGRTFEATSAHDARERIRGWFTGFNHVEVDVI